MDEFSYRTERHRRNDGLCEPGLLHVQVLRSFEPLARVSDI